MFPIFVISGKSEVEKLYVFNFKSFASFGFERYGDRMDTK